MTMNAQHQSPWEDEATCRQRPFHVLNTGEAMYPNIAEVLSNTPEMSRRLAVVTEMLVSGSAVTSNTKEETLFTKRGRETRERAERLRYREEYARFQQDLKRREQEFGIQRDRLLAEILPEQYQEFHERQQKPGDTNHPQNTGDQGYRTGEQSS